MLSFVINAIATRQVKYTKDTHGKLLKGANQHCCLLFECYLEFVNSKEGTHLSSAWLSLYERLKPGWIEEHLKKTIRQQCETT